MNPLKVARSQTKLRSLLVFLVFSASTFAIAASANPCIDLFREYRARSLLPAGIEKLAVNGKEYQIQGVLGQSVSRVYLAKDPSGTTVVIKEIKTTAEDAEAANLLYYEKAVTEFYREQGYSMPRVIDLEMNRYSIVERWPGGRPITGHRSFLVKEYAEGMTYWDFAMSNLFSEAEKERIVALQDDEYKRVTKIHKGFAGWIRKNRVPLRQHPFRELEKFIKSGDNLKIDNWLYDLNAGRWVLFDP